MKRSHLKQNSGSKGCPDFAAMHPEGAASGRFCRCLLFIAFNDKLNIITILKFIKNI